MKSTRFNVVFLGYISCLVLVGCANDPHFSQPPTAEVRASLGRVAGQSGVTTQRTADTLLELSVLQAGLAGKKYKNSPMTVFLKVQARLVRLSYGQELYRHVWMQTGSKRTYSQWASRDASLFRKELAYACRNVAVQMVREMFLAQPSRKKAWWL
jgi:hypothetical protein